MEFNEVFLASQFVVIYRGEIHRAKFSSSWEDTKAMVCRDVESFDQSFFESPEKWKLDNDELPFEWTCIHNETFITIVRLDVPCEECGKAQATVFAVTREYRPAYCQQCAVESYGYQPEARP